MANEVPTFDQSTGVYRLPSREAIDAGRGFVAGWAHAIDSILSVGDEDRIYVEAFEDIAVVAASGEIGGIQIKDRDGKFSVTQGESCGMLERWATVIDQRPGSWFRFCSTQSAGNLHNHSTSFARWVGGDQGDDVLEELRDSIDQFVSGKHKGKFERLERLTQELAAFREYWGCIDWKLGGVGLESLVHHLLEKIHQLFPGIEARAAEHQLFAWIGALALSATSDDIRDRCWTKKKLLASDPRTDHRLMFLANQIERLIGAESEKQAATLSQILTSVQEISERFHNYADPELPPTRSQQIVHDRRAGLYEARLRKMLDAEGLHLWEEIRGQIRGLDRTNAVESRPKLEQWFSGDGQLASSLVRGRVAVLIAELVLLESSLRSGWERVDSEGTREWLDRAIEAFGPGISAEDAGRLTHLEAQLSWIEGDRSKAIATLDGVKDSSCRALKLSIYLEEGDEDEAISTASVLPLDERWADRVVLTYTRHGLEEDAEAVLSWAQQQSSPVCHQRCIIAWVQGLLQRFLSPKDQRSLFAVQRTEEETRFLLGLLAKLDPLLAATVVQGRPLNGREYEAVELAFTITRILNERSRWQLFGAILSKASRVSFEYARAVCRGDLTPPPGLAERLRSEYPRSFTAGRLATVIDAISGATFSQIQVSIEKLLPLARDEEHYEQLAALLFETAIHDDSADVMPKAIETLKQLVGPTHILVNLAVFEGLRREDDEKGAAEALETARDESNPVWLQFAAEWERTRGSKERSLDLLKMASRLLGRPETCWNAFSLAVELDDRPTMREMMEAVLQHDDTDRMAMENLAAIDFNSGRFKEAVVRLRNLQRMDPEDKEIGIFLGRSLSLSGKLEEAIDAFSRVCARHPRDFQALYLKTATLDALGKAVQAFHDLHAVRESFWADMPFLMHYLDLAYKAKREDEAHLAFIRLHELQKGDPKGPLRAMSLDQLKEHAQGWREHHEEMNLNLILGKVPWTVVGYGLKRESCLDWAIRTQERQTPDRAVARAEYCVYSTNGFCVRSDAGKARSLAPVRCAARGIRVVADISALITLHRLELLDRAIAYFGCIVVPAGVSEQLLDELRSLQPHQPSEPEAKKAILSALDQGRLLSTSALPADKAAALPVLDEHHPDDQTVAFHLIDAVRWLHRDGRLTDHELQLALQVCHRPDATDPAAFSMVGVRGMRTTSRTLATAYRSGFLDRLVGRLRLYLEPDDIEGLRQAMLDNEQREEIARFHRELHTFLMNNPAVETVQPSLLKVHGDEDSGNVDHHSSLGAMILAEELKAPLLADDRYLQNMLLNARDGREGEAFGSDNVLAALAEAEMITVDDWAMAFLQLVRWRYRFLRPPAEILSALAVRHTAFPPGAELVEVCQYIHECCRDPGLFCGPEPTDPPMPLGLRYFLTVVKSIGKFLFRAWHDARFDDRAVTALTHWCVAEFLPAPPHNLPYGASVIAAESVAKILLMTAVVESYQFSDLKRSNAALAGISDTLDVSTEEYDRIMESLAELSVDLPQDEDPVKVELAARRRTVVTMLLHRDHARLSTIAVLANLGIVTPPLPPLEEEDIAAIGDRDHPRRLPTEPGPWVGIRPASSETAKEAHYVPDLLHHPHRGLRQAAVAHLQAARLDRDLWLSPHAVSLLQEQGPVMGGTDAAAARASARLVEEVLSNDFSMTLASFRQTWAMGLMRENTEVLKRLFEPSHLALCSLPAQWCEPPASSVNVVDIKAPRLSIALDRYYARYGHLPLAAPYGIESVVAAWIERNGDSGVWDELQMWAGDLTRPLKKYHAARVFLQHPSIADEFAQSAAWGNVRNVLEGYAGEYQQEAVTGEVWRMVHGLARHYMQLLEIHSYRPDEATLAAQAWWMADRVTQAIVEAVLHTSGPEKAEASLRHLMQTIVIPFVERSTLSSLLARPVREPSLFAYATIKLASVWRFALLEVQPGHPISIPPEIADLMGVYLFWGLAVGLLPLQGRLQESVWAMATPWEERTAKWSACILNTSEEPESERPLEEVKATEVPPTLSDEFRSLLSVADEKQDIVLDRVRCAVGIGALKPNDVVWLIEDSAWYDNAYKSLSLKRLNVLGECLLDLLRVGDEEWKAILPHMLRVQAQRSDLTPDRKRHAAMMTLHACIVAGRVGALVSLTNTLDPAEVAEQMSSWRVRLNEIRAVSPTPVQGRLRDILAHLPTFAAEGNVPPTSDQNSDAAG